MLGGWNAGTPAGYPLYRQLFQSAPSNVLLAPSQFHLGREADPFPLAASLPRGMLFLFHWGQRQRKKSVPLRPPRLCGEDFFTARYARDAASSPVGAYAPEGER